MSVGTVKTVREDRGYGFLVPDGDQGGNDLFFHRSAVVDDGFDRLREGQRVSYEEGPDPRNPTRRRAVNVRPMADEGGEDE